MIGLSIACLSLPVWTNGYKISEWYKNIKKQKLIYNVVSLNHGNHFLKTNVY